MSYQKHVWISEEIIRGKHLNNIEDGIYNEQERAEEAESDLLSALNAEISRSTIKDAQLQETVSSHTDILNVLNGNESVSGSVDNKIETALTDYVKNTDIASTEDAGLVKVDNKTVKIDANGVISSNPWPDDNVFIERTVALSGITDVTIAIEDSQITSGSAVLLFTNDPEVFYKTMLAEDGVCTITFPKQDFDKNVDVRIYIMPSDAEYISRTVTLSAVTETILTIEDSRIDSGLATMLFVNDPEVFYKTMLTTDGSCRITFPMQEAEKSVDVRIYVM